MMSQQKHRPSKRQAGFTLLEIIIALMIFALVATMATIGLRTVIRNQSKLNQATDTIAKLQLGITILQQDITQIIQRAATDAQGSQLSSIQSNGNKLSFTTANNPNPFNSAARGQLMRVSYQLSGNTLTRTIWPNVDAPPNSKPIVQILFKHISNLTWHFIDDQKHVLSYWQSNDDPNVINLPPRAVIMDFDLKGAGHLQRIFILGTNIHASE